MVTIQVYNNNNWLNIYLKNIYTSDLELEKTFKRELYRTWH